MATWDGEKWTAPKPVSEKWQPQHLSGEVNGRGLEEFEFMSTSIYRQSPRLQDFRMAQDRYEFCRNCTLDFYFSLGLVICGMILSPGAGQWQEATAPGQARSPEGPQQFLEYCVLSTFKPG